MAETVSRQAEEAKKKFRDLLYSWGHWHASRWDISQSSSMAHFMRSLRVGIVGQGHPVFESKPLVHSIPPAYARLMRGIDVMQQAGYGPQIAAVIMRYSYPMPTVEDCAKYLGVSRNQFYRDLQRGIDVLFAWWVSEKHNI